MFFYTHLETPAGRRPAFASLEFDDLERAYLDACASLPDIASELLRNGIDPARCWLTICNIENEALITVHFSDIIREKGQSIPRSRPEAGRSASIIKQITETNHRVHIARTALAETINNSRVLINESRRLISKQQ